MTDEERKRNLRAAIDVPRLTMDSLSRLTGCSVASLRKYRHGERYPDSARAQQIADGLRNQATALLHLADLITSDG